MSDATLIQIPLWGGLDESVDDARTPQTRMRAATNVVFPFAGVTAKRNGFTAINTQLNAYDGGTTPTSLKKLIAHKDQLCEIDAQYLYAYTPATGKHARAGRIPACVGTRQEFTASAVNVGDVADNGNYRATVWAILSGYAAGIYCSIVDKTNGAHVVTNLLLRQLAGVGACRVIAVSSSFIFITSDGISLSARAFSVSTLSFGALTPLGITDVGGLAGWDATLVVGLNLFTVGWGETTVKRIQVQTFDTTFATIAGPVVVETAMAATSTVTVRSTFTETCYVGYSYTAAGTTHFRLAHHDASTLAQTLAPYDWSTSASNEPATQGIERLTSTTAIIVGSDGANGLRWATLNATTGLVQLFAPAKEWLLMAKPFVGPTGRVYCLAIYAGQYQGTQVLVELSTTYTGFPSDHAPPLPMATIAPRASLAAIQGATAIPGNINIARSSNWSTAPGNVSATSFTCVCFAISPIGVTALQLAMFDFAHPALGQSVTLGESTYVAAGVPFAFDGVRPTECGFLHAPKITLVSAVAGGGGLWGGGGTATIKYKYVAIFAQENSLGEYSRSPPTTYAPAIADTSAFAATATHTATVRIQTIRPTLRQESNTTLATSNPITIEVYRTHWDGSAMSPTYYRVGTLVNQMDVDYVDFVDNTSNGVTETNITTKSILYTTGNVLESDCPPSMRFLCAHNNRLFGIGDEGHSIWYTTPYVQGEQPRWNDLLRIQVPDGGGDLVALASLDGRLYAFKRDRAYVIAGDGPSDTGAGADFTIPQLLPFGLGCIDARTIAVIPDGIVVDTLKGLYLFGRDGSTKWIGDRTNRTRGTSIVSAITHVADDGVVRIGLKDSEADAAAGAVLHWDYRVDCWSYWQISAANYTGPAAPRSATVVNGRYYALFVGNAGASTIAYEDPTTWLDNGSTWISMLVKSAWVTTADIQGFQRVARIQLLATRKSSHGIQMQTDYDYVFTSAVYTFSASTITAISGREILQIAPVTQKCAAMSVTITDTTSTGTGEAVQFEGLLFKVRGKRGEYKTLASAQKG